SAWKLPLSVAYWFLVILGSKAAGIRDLDEEDSAVLLQMRRDIEKRADFENLRALARGNMTWVEWKACNDQVKIQPILDQIIYNPDFLCTTPSRSEQAKTPYPDYKYKLASGIFIDEAANMDRADYACVAGNRLLPCIMGGNPHQLKPLVMTGNEKDELDYFRHRLAADGAILPMLFFQARGFPVYRLTQQLRMAKGLFDWAAEVYPELPLNYAAHCEGSRVYVNRATGSKLCSVQVRAALDFAVDLVAHTEIAARDVVILCPHAANVALAGRLMWKPRYAALLGMPPASTVDAYQGRESDIVICVLGTAIPCPGPGFTTDENGPNSSSAT
ncbi:hypothetical protein C8A05DRAFT_19785, partial [Staphylotrichum tortipilum]